jgi:hypothetical protein
MATAMTLALAASGCVQPAPQAAGPGVAVPLRVTNGDQPFAFDQGVLARKQGEAVCGAQGRALRTSIYDRYDAGAWVFVEGCA